MISILSTLAIAVPLANGPVVLGPEATSWSRALPFDGSGAELHLELDHPVLDPRSSLTVRVDGVPVRRVSLGGTPVPVVVPLGALAGDHTVSLHARLLEPGRSETCAPPDTWLRLDPGSELTGVRDVETGDVSPAGLAAALRGQAGHLDGGSDLLYLEATGLSRRWGASLDGDAFTIELVDGPTRQVDWSDGRLVVTGDAALVRALRDPEVLRRCDAWPCRFPAGSLAPFGPVPADLERHGYPQGLILTGREQAVVVMPAGGPHEEASLRLAVRPSGLEMDPASTLTLSLEGRALGRWRTSGWKDEVLLDVPLPAWALDAAFWRFELSADLRGLDERCEREARPFLTIEPHSGIAAVPAEARGLAGLAQQVRMADEASICFEEGVDPVVADLLSGLRRRGGWRVDCDAPQVVVTGDLPPGFEAGPHGAWSVDPVPAQRDRWVLSADEVLRIHVPRRRYPVAAVGWERLHGTRAVAVADGWSVLDSPERALMLPAGPGEPDVAQERRASIDLVFGGLVVLLLAAGAGWVWRSRGSRDGWLEPTS